MLISVRASDQRFRTVNFGPGFNVVLAEKSDESNEKDSRNGLGKSTLVEIIHFCLGSQLTKEDRLSSEELSGWTFYLDLEIARKKYTFSRNTSENPREIIVDGDYSDWIVQPELNDKGKAVISTDNLSKNLTYLGFQIDPFSDLKYQPSSRMLLSYLIRKGVAGYSDPFNYFPQEKTWSRQVNNSYFLNLNWEYASKLQEIKDKEKALTDLKKAISSGLMPGLEPTLGDLESDAVIVEEEVGRLEEQMRTFKVHPQYYDLEQEANQITKTIHDQANVLTIKQQTLGKYNETISEETSDESSEYEEVEKVYKDAGVLFPEKVAKTIEEVREFHSQLITNRKAYLESEIIKLEVEIKEIKQEIKDLSDRRAELMTILKTHNALDEYSLLQENVAEKRQQLFNLKRSIKQLSDIETQKSRLAIEKEQIFESTRQDIQDREQVVKRAMSLFNGNSQFLYSEGGRLSIDVTKEGYKFKVEIKRSGSQGIDYMKVFCYDLAVMQLNSDKKEFFKVLIHDSTIFDGVDERQIAKALELAAGEAEVRGFQYICTMNSDIIPYEEFSPEFKKKFEESVRITLRDGNEAESLLGFRF